MEGGKSPAAQRPPMRTPLRELQVQRGADHTSLTPLFRRLRLKDHDCATPVSCARGPRRSITAVPCTPGSRRSAPLGPPSSTPPKPCTPEPPGNTTLEAPRASLRGLRASILKSGASEAPSNATLVPGALETSSSTRPGAPDNTVPDPLCSPVLGPSTQEPPNSTVPASVCSSLPVIFESPGSTTPELPEIISSVSCSPTSPGSSTLPHCSSGSPNNASTASCTTESPGTSSSPQKGPWWQAAPPDFSCSFVASESLSANGDADPLHCQGTPEGAEFQAPVPPEESPPGLPSIETSGLELARPEAAVIPVASAATSTSMTPMSTVAADTSITPVSTGVTGTSMTPVSTRVTGTSMTPVSTGVTGTSMTPVSTRVTGTSMTPVSTRVTGTSMTPVSTRVTGTSMTPVSTRVTGTSMTPVPTRVTGTSMTPASTRVTGTSMTPVPTRDTGTSMTPVPTRDTGTFMTPWDVWERSTNTSRGSLPCTMNRAVETDSPLWRCAREQLKILSQAELEGRLESAIIITEALALQLRSCQESQRPRPNCPREQLKTLSRAVLERRLESAIIITEALSLQLCDCQESQRPRPGVGPAKQRDALTQMGTTHPEESTWSSQSLLFQSLTDAAFQSLQEEQRALAQAASLSAKAQSCREFLDVTFENLGKERRALDEQWKQMRALMSQTRALLKRVPNKLQSCLEELAATRERAEEALQAKEEVSCQLEKTLVTLQDREAQLEHLTVVNSRLSKDLDSVMINLASVEEERDALQQENEKQWEEMAQLAQERDSLQQECEELSRELQEATECREFLDQENQMCRTQLLEVEATLNSTQATLNSTQAMLSSAQATLQQHVLQHEQLMESQQRLREEQAALSNELSSTKAELLSLQTKRNRVSWCSMDIMESKMRLQELADCLEVALEEQDDDDAPSRSQAWTPVCRTPARLTPARLTPHHTGSSFVGSVLKAVAEKDTNETTRSGSTVAKDKLASVPKPIDPEDTLLESVKELRAVVSNLVTLSSRIQELEQSKFRALQTEISDLKFHLETVTAESQEKADTQAATIAKLHKALRTKVENEKELHDVVKQQEKQLLQVIDNRGEVVRLKAEASELKRLLQRAETEAKVLWEEVRGKEHQVDTTSIQERVMLRREVDKLRLLLVQKDEEKRRLTTKYLEQVRELEMKLRSYSESAEEPQRDAGED